MKRSILVVALILTSALILTISIVQAAPKKPPQVPRLVNPENGAIANLDSYSGLSFYWTTSNRATSYTIEINGPSNILEEIENNFYSTVLVPDNYAWRIRATNEYGSSSWTSNWEFTAITLEPTPTPSPTPSPSPTISPSPTPKPTPTPSPSPTIPPSPTPKPTPTPTTSPNQDLDPKPTPSPKSTSAESTPLPSPSPPPSPTSSPLFTNEQLSLDFEQRKIGYYMITTITLIFGGFSVLYVLYSK